LAGGYDRATFYDSVGDDVYAGWSDKAIMYGTGYYNDARGFDRTTANSTAGGYDRATFYDSVGDDELRALVGCASIRGSRFHNLAYGFERVTIKDDGDANVNDTAHVEAVDYAFYLNGLWTPV
jgi:hypothetical protein